MAKVKDLTGQRFGRLVVKEATKHRSRSNGNVIWRCQCDCGDTIYVPASYLKTGVTQSCGKHGENQIAAVKAKGGVSQNGALGIAGAYRSSPGCYAFKREKDKELFYFGTFDSLASIRKIDEDIKGMDYPQLLDYYVEHFSEKWPWFREHNGGNIRHQNNSYSVRVRRNNHRFYVGGVKSEVEAFKIRNLVNNMSWEEFSQWYAERFPDAWAKYVQEALQKPYVWKLTLLRLDDAELIKKLEKSDDTNKLIRDALYAYLK